MTSLIQDFMMSHPLKFVGIAVSLVILLVFGLASLFPDPPDPDKILQKAVNDHDCYAIKSFTEKYITGEKYYLNEGLAAMKVENCQ